MRAVSLAVVVFSLLAPAQGIRGEEKDWIVPGAAAVRSRLLFAQAASPDRESKFHALREIGGNIETGTISPNDGNVLSILTYLAQEGVKSETRGGFPSERNYPDVRRASCALLGRMGGEGAKKTLLSVIESESEPMVLSEAVYALALIGGKPDPKILQILTRLLEVHVLAKYDDNLAYTCLLAVEKLDTPEHRMDDPDLYRAILRMLDAPLMGEVRRKAFDVIDRLRK